MKKILLLLIIASLFAVEVTGNIKIIKKNGQTYFYKNNKEFQITKPQGEFRMLSEEVEYEEADLPVELFGLVSMVALADSGFMLSAAKDPANIKVAVIDTGMDINISSLKEYCYVNAQEIAGNGIDDDQNGFIDDYYGFNLISDNANVLDDNGHGTCMASEVAMQSKGNVKIIPIKAFDNRGCSSQFIIANAIIYAVDNGADVINCSFGYPTMNNTLRNSVQYALDQGVIIVAGAGNKGQESLMYPAGHPGVMAVSSLDDNDRISYFSNYGEHIKVSCIGESVPCVGIGGTQMKVSGTSISTAYISGTLANINGLSGLKTEDIADHYSKDVIYPLGLAKSYPGWDKYTGQGKISNIVLTRNEDTFDNSALQGLANLEVENFLNYPNPIIAGDTTKFGFNINQDATVELIVYSLNGRELWKCEQNVTGGSDYCTIEYDLKNELGETLGNDSYIAVLRAKDGTKEVLKKTVFTVLK